jgi:uncharacterized protein (DUF433 family)
MKQATGIFSKYDAARLLSLSPQTVGRWLFGYERQGIQYPPLLSPEVFGADPEEQALGFHDLLELRVISALCDANVPLVVIRKCMATARDIFRTEHPLAHASLFTDGGTIYAQAHADADHEGLIDLRTRQVNFKTIIEQSLRKGIEFGNDKLPIRWFPSSNKLVVLDPNHRFGHPVVTGLNVPTDSIYETFKAEGGDKYAYQATASIFELSPRAVKAAVDFESGLHAA